MGKVGKYDGIAICGFFVSIYELPEYYEAHFADNKYKNPDDMDVRIGKSISYLGKEGFFNSNKRIKVIVNNFSKKGPSNHLSDE